MAAKLRATAKVALVSGMEIQLVPEPEASGQGAQSAELVCNLATASFSPGKISSYIGLAKNASTPIGRVGVQFGYGQFLAGEDQLVHRAGKERQLFVNGVFTALMVLIIGVDVRVGFQKVDQAPLGFGGVGRVIALITRIGDKIHGHFMIGPVVHSPAKVVPLTAVITEVIKKLILQGAVGVIGQIECVGTLILNHQVVTFARCGVVGEIDERAEGR